VKETGLTIGRWRQQSYLIVGRDRARDGDRRLHDRARARLRYDCLDHVSRRIIDEVPGQDVVGRE
jgi:hypothetical protein